MKRPIIAITIGDPAGIGAEALLMLLLRDLVEEWKKGVVISCLIPNRVILDPELP